MRVQHHPACLQRFGVSDEAQLILVAGHPNFGDEHLHQSKLLVSKPLDWDWIISFSRQQGVLPLLHHNLSKRPSDICLPERFRDLDAEFFASTFHTLHLTGVLQALFQYLQSHDLPFLPFKGPVLASLAYGNLALRPSGDLDLLVRAADMLVIKDFLISQGYQLMSDLGWQAAFVKWTPRETVIELHRSLTPPGFPLALTLEQLWERRITADLNGCAIPSLEVEDLLIYLCVNLARDCVMGRQRLVQVFDITAALTSDHSIDLETVLLRSTHLRCRRIVLVGLGLANWLQGVGLPLAIQDAIADDRWALKLMRQIRSWLFTLQGASISVTDVEESPGKSALQVLWQLRFIRFIFYCRIRELSFWDLLRSVRPWSFDRQPTMTKRGVSSWWGFPRALLNRIYTAYSGEKNFRS